MSASEPAYLPAFAYSPGSVEVFKTNIKSALDGQTVRQALEQQLPRLQIDFDLDDCDRILRIRAAQPAPELWTQVLQVVRGLGVEIDVLPE